jgi:Ca-activated chloride channel family protein
MLRRLSLASMFLVVAGSAGALSVQIKQPGTHDPVYGAVTVVAEADHPLAKLVFLVDGRQAGVRTSAPWELKVDVGDDNAEHRFEVIADGADGGSARATITTPRLQVDEEISVQLRQLYLTAFERGRRAADLTRGEFAIADEGRPQKIVTFERGDIPFTAVLMVDTSGSMQEGKLANALAGVRAFAAGMQSLDEAALLAFSDGLVHLSRFVGPSGLSPGETSSIEAGGGTSINDYLYLAIKLLEQRNGRRTVVLLSDGVDTVSALDMAEVRERLRHSQILLYWIRLSTEGGKPATSAAPLAFASAWRTSEGHRRELGELEKAIEDSGGRVIDVSLTADVEPAFREVVDELREQYVIGYYPTSIRRDGTWHRIDVKVARPGVSVRPCGYLDY